MTDLTVACNATFPAGQGTAPGASGERLTAA